MALIRATSGSGGSGSAPTMLINQNVKDAQFSEECQNAQYYVGTTNSNETIAKGYVENGAHTQISIASAYVTVSYQNGRLTISSNRTGYCYLNITYW